MAVHKGLGKGLDSLIVSRSDDNNISNDVSRETLININKIEPNQTQPRRNFEEDALQELAESIKTHGIIQPLIVQKKGDMYEIIAGERRWRASRIAGLKNIPVIVKEYSEQEVFEIALIENIQREDLNPIEEALAYSRLVNEYSLKQDEVAERVSKSRVAVTNSLRLLKLDARVQQMLIDDMISGGHARALIPIIDCEKQYQLANKVFDEKLSVRETEKLIKSLTKHKEEKKVEQPVKEDDTIVFRDLEERLKQILGSKVSIKRKQKDKGMIEIEYYSSEELERIIDLLGSIR